MENVYSCPICGSMEMKQNGSVFLCRFCKNEFTEETLRERQSTSGNGGSSGTGSGSVTPTSGTTPATGYISGMFGTPMTPPSNGGFSAPPDSLIQSIQANTARNRQSENVDGASASNENGTSGRRSSGRGGNSGGSSGGRSNSGNNGGGSSGGGNNSGNNGSGSGNNNGSGSGGSSSGGSGSGASDSENNVRFLDNVSLMNDLAYELVNGNANAWANIARDKGIINSKQHTEIKYIVATRNCIAHGSGDTVRITAELVTSAKNYYELMRRTASQIR